MDMSGAKMAEIHNFDPIGRFLRDQLGFTPFRFGLVIFLLDLLVDGILCWYWGLFFSKSKIPGLLQDYMALTVDFVFNPVICGLYLWLPGGARRMFEGLRDAEIFPSGVVTHVVDGKRGLYRNKAAFCLALCIAILYGTSQILEAFGLVPWKTVGGYIDLHPQMVFFRAPFWYLTIYATVFIIFNIYVTIVTLRGLFRKEDAKIEPLHLDRCGGLSCISQFTLTVAYAIAAVGLLLSAATLYDLQHSILAGAYPLFLGIVVYLFLAPCFFFLPLAAAHSVMRDSKEKELHRVAKLFRAVYSRLQTKAVSATPDCDTELKRLEEMKRLYTLVSNFSVWPFDLRSLREFAVRITTPIVPAIVGIIVSIVKAKLI